MKVSADQRTESVARDPDVVEALEAPVNDAPAENYLLVGLGLPPGHRRR